MAVRAVFFDVGETLVDETRFYQEWADWLDVPALTFMGVLGGLIQQRRSHLEVFEAFRPGMDVERDRAERTAAGDPYRLEAGDLYPDAVPCLERLRAAGLVVGLAGTGDRRQTVFSAQSLSNMLERMGISVPATSLRVANMAAVMVTATLPPLTLFICTLTMRKP